jgi:tungstate transport system substrate-binding protein
MLRLRTLAIFAVLASSLVSTTGYAEEKSILVASTTSTEDSGLFKHIYPCSKPRPASM